MQSVMNDNKLEKEKGLANRYTIEYYKSQKDYSSAIRIADEILTGFNQKKLNESESSLICDALYAKGMIYSYNLKQNDKAIECFKTIVNNYPEQSLITLAINELYFLGVEIHIDKKIEETPVVKKSDFSISNHPNPFNPSTTIRFTLPQEGKVIVRIYDILGRQVAELLNEMEPAGSHSVVWNGKDSFGNEVSSGVYFYNIRYNDQSRTKKMMLVR